MTPAVARHSPFRDREFLALASAAFARRQANATVLIALALYADLFGAVGVVEGLFGTAFAVAQFLVVVPLGRAIDAGNARRYLLAGLALNVAVFVAFLLVSTPVHVVLVRMLQGLAASVLWLSTSAAVGEISPGGSRSRWMGAYNQVGAVASLAGDLIGGYLLYAHGFTHTYAVLAAVSVLSFLLVLSSLRDDPGGGAPEGSGLDAVRALLGRPTVRSLVAFRVAFSVGKMSVLLFLPIYAREAFDVSALAIGGILAGGKLAKTLTQGWIGTVTDRRGGKWRFVAAGAALYAVGTAAIPLAGVAQRTLPPLVLAGLGVSVVLQPAVLALFCIYGLLGLADSVRLPASMALFVEEGEPHDAVAASFSLRSLSWKGGHLAGPLLAGLVKDLYGTAAAFLTAAAFVAFAVLVLVASSARTGPDAAPAGPD
jgi:DHA1 family multidrug resistance protein-like MFS transporter